MHEHRGFEIVSYMLDGGVEHEDSIGVTHTASEGDAMRITAGGIEHSEFPADGTGCNGLQLWVNLPRAEKGTDPDYADAADLPTADRDGATVTTVVGEESPSRDGPTANRSSNAVRTSCSPDRRPTDGSGATAHVRFRLGRPATRDH